MKLSIAAFALAFGIWSGGGVFLLTWWLILLGSEAGTMSLVEAAYPGYGLSPLGSFVGMAWGFLDGVFFGAILAWLCNFFAKKFCSSAK